MIFWNEGPQTMKKLLRLTDMHNAYVNAWKMDIMEEVLKQFDRLQVVKMQLYVAGYDHETEEYKEARFPVDLKIFSTYKKKFQLYELFHNIEKLVPFQPLAVILASSALIENHDEQEENWAVISFQTRMSTRRYCYKAIPVVSELGGRLRLEYDDVTSKAYLGPEVTMWDDVFPLGISRN
jgi:hypothetical protein